jgi:hypothetical protein
MIELARILYGSQNYGIDGPDSDKDYKAVLCPEFADLYEGRTCKRNEGEHVTGIDVRRFHGLMMCGNPNVVELLYSVEAEVRDKNFADYLDCARLMYEAGYVASVWRTFYAALTGLCLNAMDRNGVNPKTVARAFYFMEMAKYLAQNRFIVSEVLYRGEGIAFHRLARNIRFDPPISEGALRGIAEDVKCGFVELKVEMQNSADAACKGTDWTEIVKKMDNLVQMLVWKKMGTV